MRLHNEPEWILPFEHMEIGESFFIPTIKPSPLIYAIDSGSKRAKVKVKSFITKKNNCLGIRVWRIK
tara:strand:- start:128 stop:328 length:201 start_codon:yes stop_codon:yes gene_type:complete